MNAGKFNTRVEIIRLTKTADNFGGFTSTDTAVNTVWVELKFKSGDVKQENGRRSKYTEIELMLRKKTADTILFTDILKIEGFSGRYRINDIYDVHQRFYSKILAVKID